MTTANHDQLGSRCKAHIDQATRTAQTGRSSQPAFLQRSFPKADTVC